MDIKLRENETLEDLMIDGLKIIQNKNLYRFSSDAVLLSRFADYRKGDKVADFCSGSGIVGLHYYALHRNVTEVCLFELQKCLSEMAERTVEYNGFKDKVKCFNMPVQEIPNEYNGYFSLILCNPPYKKKSSGEQNPDDHIALCRHEIAVTLEEIISVASKKLKNGGRLCICQRIERLTDVLCLMRANKLEPSKITMAFSGEKKEPYLFMAEGVKGVKPQLKITEKAVN